MTYQETAQQRDYSANSPRPGKWLNRASCRKSDPELWWCKVPSKRKQAVLICESCPVRKECLAYAVAQPHWALNNNSIWAGFTASRIQRIKAALKPLR